MSTLYRKYRPKTFAELIGQNHIKTTLQNELETDKVAQAYLFTGPRGLGKTTTARLMAKAVNCLNRKEGESEPCNQCEFCQETNAGRALDIIEIDAASHTGVDNVRENIISGSRFTPTRQKFKVFIIDEVHMLSLSAFNALLKTLEEPPAHVIFILVSTEIHKIPQTVISRCQRFDFKRVSTDDLIFRLKKIVKKEKVIVDDEILKNITFRAEGCIRDAESLLGQILALGGNKITSAQATLVIPYSNLDSALELIEYLVDKKAEPALSLINQLVQEGVDLSNFIIDLIESLRKILLMKIGGQLTEFSFDLDENLEKRAKALAKEVKLSELVFIISILINKKQELKFSEIVQLPLELAIVEICERSTNTDKDPDNPGGSGPSLKDEGQFNKVIKKDNKASPEEKGINKIKFSLEQIKEKWEEVLVQVKKYNQALASTLKFHQPVDFKDDNIYLYFRYKFHKERVNDFKNKELLEKILKDLFGQSLGVQTAMISELPEEKRLKFEAGVKKQKDPGLESVLKNFGGRLVE